MKCQACGHDHEIGGTVYVVQGRTGEYSDHQEWFVAAYLDEEQAKQHVLFATQRAYELGVADGSVVEDGEYWESKENKNQYDPGMSVYYTGVMYQYDPVPLMDKAGAVCRPSNKEGA